MARPVSRRRYLGTHVVLLVPGCALVALAYALGALAGDRTFDAPGAPLQLSRMLLAALESALLLLAIGTLAVLVSAYSSERGRALAWVLGISIAIRNGVYVVYWFRRIAIKMIYCRATHICS